MKAYWMVMARLPYHIDTAEWIKHCWLSGTEQLWQWQLPQENAPNEIPAAKLIVTYEDFDVDFFEFYGAAFVSEKMRRVMALSPSDVRYFDVDTSQCAPISRSKNYQIMRIVATDDMADPEKSVYETSPAREGCLEGRKPIIVVFRDVEPAHEIFHDGFFRFAYCTDELAVRVLQAGCTGLAFFDPSGFFGSGPGVSYRTLRGVEEDVDWDSSRNTMVTKVIRGIH